MEIWPALDVVEGRVVRLSQGRFDRETAYADNPFEYLLHRFDGVPPRLHLVDLSGAVSGRFGLFTLVERLAQRGVRIQTGGGLRTLEAIRRVVEAGAERVVVGSQLVQNSAFRRRVREEFPGACVAGLDVKEGRLRIAGWNKGGPPAELFWMQLRQEGWERAQVTDISRDGTLSGIQASFWESWSRQDGSIGAGGGIATIADLKKLEALGIDFAVVGKAWIEGHIPIEELVSC
jgi:phosphoribosylformimino-5-aminoimidazole carboxamide ribotide isomerase